MFKRKTKKVKIPTDIFNQLKELANNIEVDKNGMTTLYGVYADFDMLCPVPADIATKYVEYEGKQIGCLTTKILSTVFITKQAAEKYIEINKEYLDEPEIQPLCVSVGRTQPELNFIANTLALLFKDKK